MNSLECLLNAVINEPKDRPSLICPGGMMTMAVSEALEQLHCSWPTAHSDAALMARLTEGMVVLGGHENLGVPFCMTIEAEEMGAGVDLGHLTREPHVVRYALDRLGDCGDLPQLDPAGRRSAARPYDCSNTVIRISRLSPI